MHKDKFSFSIVVPTLNEENYISYCLNSILEQNYDPELIEVIVVDGNSTDKTIPIIKQYQEKYPNIKLFFNPERKTPISLNIGIKNASGDVAVILGAHATIDKDFIRYNNHYMIEKNVKVTGGTQYNVGLTVKQKLIGIVMQMPFAMASAEYRWSKKEQFVDTVVYAAYKKEIFDEVGYFEENFTISEDAEINWRIRRAGYKIYYSPKIISYYYPRSSLAKFIKQMFRYGILRVNVLKKHLNSFKLFHAIPPFFVLTLMTLFFLAPDHTFAYYTLAGIISLHFSISLFTGFNKFRKDYTKWAYVPLLPFLIFLMHFAWGLGYILGLVLPKSKKW